MIELNRRNTSLMETKRQVVVEAALRPWRENQPPPEPTRKHVTIFECEADIRAADELLDAMNSYTPIWVAYGGGFHARITSLREAEGRVIIRGSEVILPPPPPPPVPAGTPLRDRKRALDL